LGILKCELQPTVRYHWYWLHFIIIIFNSMFHAWQLRWQDLKTLCIVFHDINIFFMGSNKTHKSFLCLIHFTHQMEQYGVHKIYFISCRQPINSQPVTCGQIVQYSIYTQNNPLLVIKKYHNELSCVAVSLSPSYNIIIILVTGHLAFLRGTSWSLIYKLQLFSCGGIIRIGYQNT